MQLDLLAAKGTLVAVGLLVLHAFVPFDPAVVTAPLVREDNTAARSALARASVEAKGLRFSEATFASNGVNCHAWVIAPPGGGPCTVSTRESTAHTAHRSSRSRPPGVSAYMAAPRASRASTLCRRSPCARSMLGSMPSLVRTL